jgi:hypothetical protein
VDFKAYWAKKAVERDKEEVVFKSNLEYGIDRFRYSKEKRESTFTMNLMGNSRVSRSLCALLLLDTVMNMVRFFQDVGNKRP